MERDGKGQGGRFVQTETEALGRDARAGWAVCVTAANPNMLRHARGCSHYGDYPACRLVTSKPDGADCKKVSELGHSFTLLCLGRTKI